MPIKIILNSDGTEHELVCCDVNETELGIKLSLPAEVTATARNPNNKKTWDIDSASSFKISYPNFDIKKEKDSPNGPMILPIQLFGIGMSSSTHFVLHNVDATYPQVITFSKSDLYYTAPPDTCNGLQLDAFWLHERYWGGIKKDELPYYKVKIPIALGPNGIPIVWRELRAVSLSNQSLVGFSVSHCKVPDNSKPVLVSNFLE
jgi:hypothetical protein